MKLIFSNMINRPLLRLCAWATAMPVLILAVVIFAGDAEAAVRLRACHGGSCSVTWLGWLSLALGGVCVAGGFFDPITRFIGEEGEQHAVGSALNKTRIWSLAAGVMLMGFAGYALL